MSQNLFFLKALISTLCREKFCAKDPVLVNKAKVDYGVSHMLHDRMFQGLYVTCPVLTRQ